MPTARTGPHLKGHSAPTAVARLQHAPSAPGQRQLNAGRPAAVATRGACACGGGCPRCAGTSPPARPAPIAPAHAPQEAEAERIATQLSPGPAAPHTGPAEPTRQGTPLPADLRAHYEPRFGRSLAGIRLHTGTRAAQSAAALGAHAYTLGREIHLGADRAAVPGYTMAHEIAHALHHAPGVVWREPYTTTGQALSRSSMVALAGSDYWTYRSGQRYDLVFDARMTANAEERDAVLAAMWAGNPPATVAAQVVRELHIAARTTGSDAAAVTHPALHYRLTFDPPAPSATLPQLTTTFVAEGPAAAGSSPTVLPASYASRGNATDFALEQLRGRRSGALGTVTLPAGLPADEVAPVQYAVAEYFDHAGVRNSEVDAVVPVGAGSRTVLYTFVFGASNHVSVTRVGEAGAGTAMIDVNRIDVSRVRGFPGASAAPAALRSWWTSRYPGGGALAAAADAAASVVIAEMNQLMAAGIGSRGWFSSNYGISVLDGIGLESRLQTMHSVPSDRLLDVQDPSADDLRALEIALQTLTDSERQRLRGVNIGRKAGAFSHSTSGSGASATTTWNAGTPGQFGLTLHHGSDITVVYFDALTLNNAHLFRGSTAANALADATMGLLHELGHASGHAAGVEATFNAWFRARRQVAPTWYAATASDEVFPEAWALYHTDPHFLCSRAPQVYAWIDQLATTGTAPAGTAALPAPSTCPP